MAHDLWYALYYDTASKPIVDKVTLPLTNDMTHLRQAIYHNNVNKLKSLDASDLNVYPTGTAISNIDTSATTIELDTLTSTLVTTARQPIIVVARAPASPTSTPTLSSADIYLQPLPPHHAASQYWTRLMQCNIIDNAIDLTPATALAMEGLPSRVYIRQHYESMYDRMLHMAPNHRFIIRGTPGIGKSLFAVYLMYRHRHTGTIVYHPRNAMKCLYISTSIEQTPYGIQVHKNSLRLMNICNRSQHCTLWMVACRNMTQMYGAIA